MLIHVIRPIPQAFVTFVEDAEEKRLTAYPDPRTGGAPWTIGFGSTRGVVPGMTISEEECLSRLRSDAEHAARELEEAIGEDVVMSLTDNQYAALLSFVFNCGCDPKWTICKELRKRNYDAVPTELMRFVNAKGRKMQGLVNRRAKEVILWSTGEPGSTPEALPSSITRVIPTPPTPVHVAPIRTNHNFLASLAVSVAAVFGPAVTQAQGALKAATDAVAPFVGDSEILQHLKGEASIAMAALAVAATFFAWASHQEARNQ